ncbi:MAG: DUF86 domain-containing protein [Coriobacteriia bacterium]|nr:DUF86 domain-containing protein [Coriobacteriia bacterium]
MWRDDASLLDMLIWARRAHDFTAQLKQDAFEADQLVQSATVRCLEVIGEAASRVSPAFREGHPEIPWREIMGMRKRLAHEYGHVDLAEVWRAATRDCPQLISQLEPLVPADSLPLPDEWEFL